MYNSNKELKDVGYVGNEKIKKYVYNEGDLSLFEAIGLILAVVLILDDYSLEVLGWVYFLLV